MAGIYIHIPFCRQACHYCNFHFSTSLQQKDAMIAAIANEISITPTYNPNALYPKEIVETVYFGGGTPSLLTEQELSLILDSLHAKFSIQTGAEITLEANPDDINPAKLLSWKKVGINRLSVGIQSFSGKELKWMNRAHTAADSLRCIDDIQQAGFDNYSIDLIYGSPLLSNLQWHHHVHTIIDKKVPHVSCYALTVEPKTALHKLIEKQQKLPVDPEKQADQFLMLVDWMTKAGYAHYEISNFAQPGKQSNHNSSYWQGKKYYGFGPAAHSFTGSSRRWNIANNALYIQALQNQQVPFEEEHLTLSQQVNEYILTTLRTSDGLNLKKVARDYGQQFSEHIDLQSKQFITEGRLEKRAASLVLTREGKLFADGIAADLFVD